MPEGRGVVESATALADSWQEPYVNFSCIHVDIIDRELSKAIDFLRLSSASSATFRSGRAMAAVFHLACCRPSA